MCQWDSGPGGSVLVLGDYRQTVTVVRSLARAGYEVTLATDDPRSAAARSRYLSGVWTYQSSCAKRFLDSLEGFLRAERPDFVFVVGESQLRCLAGAAARFAPLATWANAPFDVVARCFDTRAISELAAGLGIPALPDPLELQKPDAGTRHTCHVAADEGELIVYFQQKDGVSVAPDTRLRDWCAALVRAVGYSGVGCIQFLVDEASGEAWFLGFNASMDSTAALPYRLGYDFPRFAMRIAGARRQGRRAPSSGAYYPPGRKYHWLYGDLWDLLDPLPALHLLSRKLLPPQLAAIRP